MPEMKTLNGYEVVDAKAREDIKGLQEAIDNIDIPEVPDLTPYATETYVDNAIDNIVFPETDLSKHALKSEIPTSVSQLQNDSKFITREEVPETDLSEYAKKSELPTVPTKVSAFTNDAGYLTAHQDISGKADKVHSHPEYLTEHQSLDEYAKKSEIPDVSNFITSIPKEYITESELEAKQYLTAIPSEYITETELAAMGYATGGYVDAKVANIVIPDLTPYAKKTDIPDISTKADKGHSHAEYLTAHQDVSHLALKSSVPTKLSELVNDKNFISEIPSEYVTDAELANKGYLTEHQSLTNYATKPYVQTIVEEAQPDLTKYAKKTDVPSIAGLATEDYVDEEVADAKAWVTDRGYATESYVKNAILDASIGEGTEIDISGLATKDDIKDLASTAYVNEKVGKIVIPEVPTKVSELTNDKGYITSIPSEYVTEAELGAKGYLTEHQSLAAYATKTYVENVVAENQPNLTRYALKTDIPDTSAFLTSVPAEYVTESELSAKGYLTQHQDISGKADRVHSHPEYLTAHQDLSAYAKKSEIPDVSEFITAIPAEYITESELEAKKYLTEHQDLSEYAKKSEIPSHEGLATEEYVNNAIDNIDIPEPDLTGYATEAFVREAVANAAAGDIDLSDYATHDDMMENRTRIAAVEGKVGVIESKNYLTEIPSEYITGVQMEAFVNGRDYISTTAANNKYFPKTDGQTLQASVAAINEAYASKTYVNNTISGYATTATVSALETRVTNLDGSGKRVNTLEADVAALESKVMDYTVKTQAEYDALSYKEPNTFYFIKES